MAKRNSDGDVLANKLNLGLAKHKSLLASWMGSESETAATNDTADHSQDDDLRQDYAHDRLGVGSILPKDIADGSFTRRIPSSNDKLLVQLLGAKKAKAHIAAQQEAARPNASARAQRYGKPAVVKKDESDEEEEGRAATFKSKRSEKKMNREIDSDDEDEEMRSKRLAANTNMAEQHATANNIDAGAPPTGSEHSEEAPRAEEPVLNEPELKEPDVDSQTTTPKSAPRKSRAKPKSFLDEILAERSKKKSKKSQA